MNKLATSVLHLCVICALSWTAPAVRGEEITAQGSDSTLGLVKALAQAFEAQSGTTITLHGGGSSLGAKECIAGNIQLAFLSRKLKDKETDAGLVGMSYALDGVAIVVNQGNPLDSIDIDTLKAIYTGEKSQWDDGKPILAFNRNPNSGTREVFEKNVLGKGVEFGARVQIKHDAALIPTVSKTVTSIGYTSAGDVDESQIKVLAVNGVMPTAENIRNASYPISRTLTLATNAEPSGAVQAFMDFVRSDAGQTIIKENGYVTLQ